ncbi:MAG: chromosome partitioning protein ParB [Clostridiales bacterium]|nr:chromosome partitioning protein ParB [Clostridiales bacterium]
MPSYDRTLTSARAFAEAGRLEEWIHQYLLTDGNNAPFSEGLKLFPRSYLGPVDAPLSLFRRCCGPEEGMKWRVHPVHFENKVQRLMEAAKADPDLPPLIVCYRFSEVDGTPEFELNDGNGRYEAYTRLGRTHAPVVFWITEAAELADFQSRYGWLLSGQPEGR